MKIKKIQLFEIIDSNGELIGKNDVPTNDANADTQANNTTDYNSKIAQQPFRYDMLGRFGFTLLPFFEGKEDEGQKELLKDLAQLMHDKHTDTLRYYYKNPNLLKPDYRKEDAGEAHSEQCEKEDIDWARKIIKIVEPHFEKAFKEPIDEEVNSTIPFDNSIKDELKKIFSGSNYDKAGILDQRIEQLLDMHGKWLEMAKKQYGAEEIAQKLFAYDKNLNKINEDKIVEDNVVEDKLVDKSEDEMSKKAEDNDIKEKKLEKIAGLISKLDQKDKDKLANLLERK
ncbi:MAG: hypothetical protein WC428_00415 [Candidatus Paceibacterota bacterium]